MPEAMSAAVAFPKSRGRRHSDPDDPAGIPVARCDFVFATTRPLNKLQEDGYREAPTVFLEFHGSPRVVEQAEACRRSRTSTAARLRVGDEAEERSKLWDARHYAYFACLLLRRARGRSYRRLRADLRLAECVHETMQGLKNYSRRCRSSATSVTATSTSSSSSIPRNPRKWRTRRRSTSASSSARCASKAPAPASTASASARWPSCARSSATT